MVIVGPYEHHSFILPWCVTHTACVCLARLALSVVVERGRRTCRRREAGAHVVQITIEAAAGGPCLEALEAALRAAKPARLVIGAFSAASNMCARIDGHCAR